MSTIENVSITNTATKFHQDEATLKKMTEKACQKAITNFSATELGGGMCNAVYLVKADGECFVIKIGYPTEINVSMRHEADMIVHEANMLKLFEERINIPAPKLILLDTSKELCKADYFVMSFMEGIPLMEMENKPTEEQLAKIKYQVGEICKEISSVKGDYFGLPNVPATQKSNNFDFVHTLFQMLLADAFDKNITLPDITPEELLNLIAYNRDALNDNVVPVAIHTDTWDGNLMIKDGELVGIIDFAAVFYGDFLMSHDFHDLWQLNQNFAQGFGKTEFSHNEKIRMSIYKLWQCLYMYIEHGFRNYEGGNIFAWVGPIFSDEVKHLKSLCNYN